MNPKLGQPWGPHRQGRAGSATRLEAIENRRRQSNEMGLEGGEGAVRGPEHGGAVTGWGAELRSQVSGNGSWCAGTAGSP